MKPELFITFFYTGIEKNLLDSFVSEIRIEPFPRESSMKTIHYKRNETHA